MSKPNGIYVTRTNLPKLEHYIEELRDIWSSSQLTNHGQKVLKLEQKLSQFQNAKNMKLVANGTLALQIAFRAARLTGEVITTPFSYVATTSSLVWEGLKPRFVDIDPCTLTIDPSKIEDAITKHTSAIVATHVYGIPCNILALEKICRRHKLKLIFDASHAFGVKYRNKPLTSYGDISTLSFHATKLFYTAEGGAIITKSSDINERVISLRNFGHHGEEEFSGLGINAKMSELHAAMGLCILPLIKERIRLRRERAKQYDTDLFGQSLSLQKPEWPEQTEPNFSYYPILFRSESDLLKVRHKLNKENIFPRRYFYPSLQYLPYLPKSKKLLVSDSVSRRVLCLPIHDQLPLKTVRQITKIIGDNLSRNR